ncbi:hypothetical protein GCM10009700_20840 [Brevibacterium sanguinis]
MLTVADPTDTTAPPRPTHDAWVTVMCRRIRRPRSAPSHRVTAAAAEQPGRKSRMSCVCTDDRQTTDNQRVSARAESSCESTAELCLRWRAHRDPA